jgi:hypothetical protein
MDSPPLHTEGNPMKPQQPLRDTCATRDTRRPAKPSVTSVTTVTGHQRKNNIQQARRQPAPNPLPTTELPPLKLRWVAFLCFYFESWRQKGGISAARAARLAGYSPRSSHVTAHRILHNPKVLAYLRALFEPRIR